MSPRLPTYMAHELPADREGVQKVCGKICPWWGYRIKKSQAAPEVSAGRAGTQMLVFIPMKSTGRDSQIPAAPRGTAKCCDISPVSHTPRAGYGWSCITAHWITCPLICCLLSLVLTLLPPSKPTQGKLLLLQKLLCRLQVTAVGNTLRSDTWHFPYNDCTRG